MSVHTNHGIRCGNRAQHGEDIVYHATTQAVKDCFAESGRFQSEVFTAEEQARIANAERSMGTRAQARREEQAALEAEVAAKQAEAKAERERREAAARRYAAWRSIPVEISDYARYALPSSTGGAPDLYRVRRPSTGQHKGKTFVDREVGRTTVKMPWAQSAEVLDRIAADPVAAAVLYGKATTTCSICHRKLRAPESVERGIGPVCLSRMGGVAPAPEPEVERNQFGDPMHETPCVCGPYDRCRGRRAQDAADSGNWRDQFRAYND